VLDAAWMAAPLGVAAAVEDGSLRCLTVSARLVAKPGGKASASVSFRGAAMGALWAVACTPTLGAVAYAGEDGVLALAPDGAELLDADRRRRGPHAVLGALRLAPGGGALRVLSAAQAEAEGSGLYQGQFVERMAGLGALRGAVPPPEVATRRLAWSPPPPSHGVRGAWLAAGTEAGVVRLVWVAAR
jgi:hypothetical protein